MQGSPWGLSYRHQYNCMNNAEERDNDFGTAASSHSPESRGLLLQTRGVISHTFRPMLQEV